MKENTINEMLHDTELKGEYSINKTSEEARVKAKVLWIGRAAIEIAAENAHSFKVHFEYFIIVFAQTIDFNPVALIAVLCAQVASGKYEKKYLLTVKARRHWMLGKKW